MSLKLASFFGAVAGVAFAGGLLVAHRLPPQETTSPPAVTAPAPEIDALSIQRGLPSGPLPDLSVVAERALRAAANITSTRIVRTDPWTQLWTGQYAQQSQSLGSGVVVDPSGIVLTNTHVIGDAGAEVSVSLADGRERPGRIVGIDEMSDVAVIKIEGNGLDALPWGDSSKLRIAEWVLAIGNPYQLSGTVTLGIVSTVNRSAAEVGAVTDYIQTDAAINPGNSGGALVNQRGELVGINTLIFSQTGGYQGLSFAIPSNTARRIMTELVDHGRVRWGSIGAVQVYDVTRDQAGRAGIGDSAGVLVGSIAPSSSAYRAGLRRLDFIVAVQGRPVPDTTHLTREIVNAPVGSRLKLDVIREGRRLTIEVPVVARETGRRR
jgi:S1-C subfamily serine protease